MKVVVAPDSFKGSLTAEEAALCIEKGLLKATSDIEITKIPMADGGEGTVRALVAATNGTLCTTEVCGPLGDKVLAEWGILGDSSATAVIEMAAASGLTLLPQHKRNPYHTTTFGVGELILAALDAGCSRVIIGIGGSATNDAGVGMAQALGVRFYDKEGQIVPAGGLSLAKITDIDVSEIDSRLKRTQFVAACDVDNPLYGENGAAYVYGPQKGASPEMVKVLDLGLRTFAQTLTRSLGVEVANVPGAGAAGGLGAGLLVFVGAKLQRGIDIVCEAVGLREKLRGADVVFTGEGQVDSQSARGKTAWGVAKLANSLGVPVVVVAGSIAPGATMHDTGFSAMFSICPRPLELAAAMCQAKELLSETAYNLMRVLIVGERIGRRDCDVG